MFKRLALLFWIIVATLTVLCGEAGLAATAQPIRVASIFAHSGKAAEENSPNYVMTRLAVQAANEQGGVLGRPLELLELDNQSTALGSRQAVLEAIEAGVVAVVGPSWSSHAMAMAPELQKAGIPMVGATTSAPEVTQVGDYIFRACYTNQAQAQALASFAAETLRARNVATLVVAGDVYSEDLASQFQAAFERLGGRVVVREAYLLSSMDFERQLTAVRDCGPDMVFVPGFARDSGLILRQARSMGMNLPFLGGDGWTALEEYPHLGTLTGENYYVSHWHKDFDSAASRDFLRLVTEKLGPDALQTLDAGNPVAYDAMRLVIDAISRAGVPEPAAIREALAETRDFPGVTGIFTFNDTGDPDKPLVVLKISGNAVHYVQTVHP